MKGASRPSHSQFVCAWKAFICIATCNALLILLWVVEMEIFPAKATKQDVAISRLIRDVSAEDQSVGGDVSSIGCKNAFNVTSTAPDKATKPHLIVVWNKYSIKNDWFMKHSVESKTLMEACYKQGMLRRDQVCHFTSNRSRVAEADTVLFRMRSLELEDLPPVRHARQQYLVFEHEPPHKNWLYLNLTQYNGFFNLTSTYAWDSDIPTTQRRKFIIDQEKYNKNIGVNFASDKRRDVPVTWFVSRCPTQSKRENYVAEMQKYIKVDIYGKCGSLTCKKKAHRSFKSDECVETLLNGQGSYKFYLAFENSLCEDYVTEKIWKVVSLRVVPVVMGVVAYEQLLPPKTFIDVRDFDSPKSLAEYLLFLNQNDEEYNQYLRAIDATIEMTFTGGMFAPKQCHFCKGLLEPYNQIGVVHALDKFWGSNRCKRPEEFLRRRKPHDFGFNLKEMRDNILDS